MLPLNKKLKNSRIHCCKDYLLAVGLFVLINIFVFHKGLYRFICTMDSYAGNVYGRMSVLESTEKKSNQPVIAVIGDSTAEDGVDPRVLSQLTGIPAVNLALPGTESLEWLHFLKSIDSDRNRFGHLVFIVSPQPGRIQADNDGIQTLVPVASISEMMKYVSTREKIVPNLNEYYKAFDRIYAFRSDLRNLFLHPDRLLFIGANRREQIHHIQTWSGMNFDVCSVKVDFESGSIRRWGTLRDEKIRSLARSFVKQTSRLNKQPRVSGILENLEKITQYYQNSSTKILIVSIPFGMGHQIYEESKPIAKFLKELERISEPPNVWHWIAHEEKLFKDCKNFYDFRHLNTTGRRLFTTELSRQIQTVAK